MRASLHAKGGQPIVLAKGNSFFVAYVPTGMNKTYGGVWNGAGISTPVKVSDYYARIVTDGAQYVAAWGDGAENTYYSTSTDGATWTTPGAIEAAGQYSFVDLAGGPSGVIVTTSKGYSTGIYTRALTSTGWSDSVALNCAYPWEVHTVVGSANAVIACAGSPDIDAQEWDGAAFTHIPFPTGKGGKPFAIASDGTDFRVDYGNSSDDKLYSSVLHAGAWGPIGQDPLVSLYSSSSQWAFQSAGGCGAWLLMFEDSSLGFSDTRTTGSLPYAAGATLKDGNVSTIYAPIATTHVAGQRDAFWLGPATNSGPSRVIVALGF